MLVIFRVDLEVALGMVTGRADIGGIGTYDDVAAVATLPNLDFALGKDL